MTLFIERRHLSRFKIPGSKVSYKQEEGFQGSLKIEDIGDLIDLTVKGIRFETTRTLFPGAKVDIEIIVPGEKKINLIGNVVWTSKVEEEMINTVVEFLEFDNETGYNSLECLNDLELLTAKYSN